MFDNFGLGEFFFLALLALLFFGPERLPQIGARLGRWVGNLTQYSKAFMTEWREEALAIHDAVEEVKGIRDEIVAAQREISGTLDTAREDMVDGLDAAKEAVSDATTDVRTRIQQQRVRAVEDFDQLGEGESGTDSSASVSGASGTDHKVQRLQCRGAHGQQLRVTQQRRDLPRKGMQRQRRRQNRPRRVPLTGRSRCCRIYASGARVSLRKAYLRLKPHR